ncbi:MAG TPA: hypothetical protein VJB87_04655 [Candidatus Nanoarchaeia archaeon]|nr:hypothetical protein [Candidatus Nanoarchaeia archaeon]
MTLAYHYSHHEANFGLPLKKQVKGGMHVVLEIVLQHKDSFIALRRPGIPGHEPLPEALFFCHDLPQYGESLDIAAKRIVVAQCGSKVKSTKVVTAESFLDKKEGQWVIILYIVAQVEQLPKPGVFGNKVSAVKVFGAGSVPDGFAWWSRKDVKDFLVGLS